MKVRRIPSVTSYIYLKGIKFFSGIKSREFFFFKFAKLNIREKNLEM